MSQLSYFRRLGLRDRILSLPVMTAAVLTLLWRQVPSVCELTRMLAREKFLWAPQVKVSQPALSKRFVLFPYEIFRRALLDLVPILRERSLKRERPLPKSVEHAGQHFDHIWAVDGSTLEALFRKLKALKDVPVGQLAGKICSVIDLVTHMPVETWFRENASDHDSNFLPQVLAMAKAKVLFIFDRGFYDFTFFGNLIEREAHFITRLKSNAVFSIERTLLKTDRVREHIIKLGGRTSQCQHLLRLIEVRHGIKWYRYVTSALDPNILPAVYVADLYRRRWRIEEAFAVLKRLIGLSYLWTGSINGILLQVWSSWLFYATLIDLADAVAEELMLPFDRISLEMVFRGLYHFIQAYDRGEATDPVKYLAAPENRDLGVVKRLRKKTPDLLNPETPRILGGVKL
ncbi:MAG: IS4 family transposase [Anaerolineae bacterium]|nr:IS4 family transposase [Anaerolineae bacterium]